MRHARQQLATEWRLDVAETPGEQQIKRVAAQSPVLVVTYVARLPVMTRHMIPGRPEQVAEARAFVRAVLGEDHPAAETAVLLTSELVTNSVLHSASARDGGTVTVTVAEIPEPANGATGLVRVEVTDDGAPGLPALRPLSGGDENGHGLHLVDALAARWGCCRDGERGEATTWFELTW